MHMDQFLGTVMLNGPKHTQGLYLYLGHAQTHQKKQNWFLNKDYQCHFPPSDKFSSSRPVSKRFQRLSPPPESSSSSSQPVPHTRNSSDMQIDSLVGNGPRLRPTGHLVRSDSVNLNLEDMEEEVGQDRQSDYEGDMEGDSASRNLDVDPAIVDRQLLEVKETVTGAEGGEELGLEYPIDVASSFGDVVGTRGTATEDKLGIPNTRDTEDTGHVGDTEDIDHAGDVEDYVFSR
ncbi:hypothetical protein F5050DRAFT_1709261 [Lentinula boryana]|uniref:Uncharacterized protein n=1 Tax=Lentinula boryana TaxID=40481 RepID=A0ABQ8QNK6_9AGAR|nr:hypothetical protein F5050DRAFT_1709261 [Lentinula boryana]